jgi:hypothetical protein
MTPTPFLIYGKQGHFNSMLALPEHPNPLWFAPQRSARRRNAVAFQAPIENQSLIVKGEAQAGFAAFVGFAVFEG